MSKVAIQGNATGTGVFTIASPATNTDRTLTLPDEAGTVLTTATPGVPVNGPAFSAYLSANTGALSSGTHVKITCDTEEFDTNSNYASGAFTPTVAGYYQINGAVSPAAFAGNYLLSLIYKNGSLYKNGSNFPVSSSAGPTTNVSTLVYLNGSTDYVELYVIANGTPIVLGGSSYATYFNGAMVRAA